MTGIVRLDLLISNAYLVGSGRKKVLIDTGSDFAYPRLRKQLAKHGVAPGDIALVLLTHAHPDHAGAAARLKRDFGAPVAVHAAEAEWLRTGTTELYQPCGLFGHFLNRVIPRRFEACEVDRVLNGDEVLDLDPGIGGLHVLHTPGHTPGHLCVECEGGDLFAGDLMRGGMLRRDVVAGPFFVQDRRQLDASVRAIKARRPACLHFGHGHAAGGEALARSTPST